MEVPVARATNVNRRRTRYGLLTVARDAGPDGVSWWPVIASLVWLATEPEHLGGWIVGAPYPYAGGVS